MKVSAHRDLPGGLDIEAAGESFYAAGLQELACDGLIARRAALVPDLGNPYDRNAVCIVIDGVHVGHLDPGIVNDVPRGRHQGMSIHEWLRAAP